MTRAVCLVLFVVLFSGCITHVSTPMRRDEPFSFAAKGCVFFVGDIRNQTLNVHGCPQKLGEWFFDQEAQQVRVDVPRNTTGLRLAVQPELATMGTANLT